jgi:hypothetical protein
MGDLTKIRQSIAIYTYALLFGPAAEASVKMRYAPVRVSHTARRNGPRIAR